MKWLASPKALAVTATLFAGLLLALHLIPGPGGQPLLTIKVETTPLTVKAEPPTPNKVTFDDGRPSGAK